MSSVDVASIEASMKMANLDGLRGYAQNHYGEIQQEKSTEYIDQSSAAGYQVLREPLWNKGQSFFSALVSFTLLIFRPWPDLPRIACTHDLYGVSCVRPYDNSSSCHTLQEC
jgi:hypothetical protein